MGSDLYWCGKQDDPVLRRALTEDLEKVFTAIGWKFEVWHSNPALNATVRFPYEHRKRLWRQSLGEKEPDLYPEEEKEQIVFREGLVVNYHLNYPGVLSKEDRREMSFAFINGPDLPEALKNRIYSLSDLDWKKAESFTKEKGMPQHLTIPTYELVDGGHQRFIDGEPWRMALLLMLIKRLYIPGLDFADDYGIEDEAGEWAENVRLFLSPGGEIRNLLFNDQLRCFIKGEIKEVEDKKFPVWSYSTGLHIPGTDENKRDWRTRNWWRPSFSTEESVDAASPDSSSVRNSPICMNPEPEYGQYFQRLSEWLASKDPSRLRELYQWMGECGNILGGRIVVFQDAVVFSPSETADLFIFPLWEIIAGIPRISQCFEVNLESLKEQIDILAATKEPEPADEYNKVVPVEMPPDQRGNFIRILLNAISRDRNPLTTSLSTSEWVMEKTRNGMFKNWNYWDGFIVSRVIFSNPLVDTLLVSVSWKVIRELQSFVDGWEFSRSGGVAILTDNGEEWFSIRTSSFLKKAGFWNLAALVQMDKEELRAKVLSTPGGTRKSFNEIIDFFDDDEHGLKEAVLQLGVNFREWFFGPEPACGTFWPLAMTKACRQATCLKCIQNVSGETVDIRFCALRKYRIEKEHEDFCISYQRESNAHSSTLAIGPVYRMMAGGPVGFRPLEGS